MVRYHQTAGRLNCSRPSGDCSSLSRASIYLSNSRSINHSRYCFARLSGEEHQLPLAYYVKSLLAAGNCYYSFDPKRYPTSSMVATIRWRANLCDYDPVKLAVCLYTVTEVSTSLATSI